MSVIGRICGILVEKTPPLVLIDVQGVGYEINVPMSTFFGLPHIGQTVALLTHLQVREDAHVLFGFSSAVERHTFRELLRVNGIGARTALSILSGLSVNDIATAISLQDTSRLRKVPGIGPKTAERLVLELKGRLSATTATTPMNDQSIDVVNALLALGYSDKEAAAAAKLTPPDVGVSEAIRLALKYLSKS